MRDNRPLLLVEDDVVDAMVIRRAFEDLRLHYPLIHMTNGEEAIAHLQDEANEKPGLILLDLNMPKMGGLEFLERVKSHPLLKTIPVLALTTSDNASDINASFELGANGYFIKPTNYQQSVEVIRAVTTYWMLSRTPGIQRRRQEVQPTLV